MLTFPPVVDSWVVMVGYLELVFFRNLYFIRGVSTVTLLLVDSSGPPFDSTKRAKAVNLLARDFDS